MERNTRVRASQIIDILPEDLSATIALGTGMDGYIPKYDDATGKFTWIPNGGGAKHIISIGFELSNNSTDKDYDIDVSPGTLYHGSTEVSKINPTTIQIDNNAHWIDGSLYSFAGGIGFAYIYVKNDGTIRFDEKVPDYLDIDGNKGDFYGIFNTTTSNLSIPDHADWDLGTGDFTLEGKFFFYPDVFGYANYCFFDIDSTNHAITFFWGSNTLYFSLMNGATSGNRAWTPILYRWYHIAMVRSSGNISFWVDGTQIGTSMAGATSISSSASGLIGEYGVASRRFNGRMNELRISNIARYTTTFIPSIVPFTSDSNTKLLLHLDNNVIDSGNTGHTITKTSVTFSTDMLLLYYKDGSNNYWRILGAVRVATDNTIDAFYQSGNKFIYDIPISITTTKTASVWSSPISLITTIPAISNLGIFGLYVTSSDSNNRGVAYIRPNGSTFTLSYYASVYAHIFNSGGANQRECFTDTSRQIQYNTLSTAALFELGILGYIVNIR